MGWNLKAKITVTFETELDDEVDYDYDCEIVSKTLAENGRNGLNSNRNTRITGMSCEYTKVHKYEVGS